MNTNMNGMPLKFNGHVAVPPGFRNITMASKAPERIGQSWSECAKEPMDFNASYPQKGPSQPSADKWDDKILCFVQTP